jgi:hypothetical protein
LYDASVAGVPNCPFDLLDGNYSRIIVYMDLAQNVAHANILDAIESSQGICNSSLASSAAHALHNKGSLGQETMGFSALAEGAESFSFALVRESLFAWPHAATVRTILHILGFIFGPNQNPNLPARTSICCIGSTSCLFRIRFARTFVYGMELP